MTTSNFGGHRAAPFRKGGKRRAKVLLAKSAVRAAKKGASLSTPSTGKDIDLGFNPAEKRDRFGRWVKGGDIKKALDSAEPGSHFTVRGAKFTKNTSGNWDSPEHSNNYAGEHDAATLAGFGRKGFLKTLDDQRIEHSQLMDRKDKERLAKGATALRTTAGKREAVKRLKAGQPVIGMFH